MEIPPLDESLFGDPFASPGLPSSNDKLKGRKDEEVRLGKREIYVAYGAGMGRSKLKIPAAANGTARNINTIAKLAELAAST